jgi:pilus assembly protein CpaC
VRVRTGVSIASFGFSAFLVCAPSAIAGQAVAEAAQASTPATQTTAPAAKNPAAEAPAAPTQTVTQAVGPVSQDSANDLSVTVGKAVVLDLARPITRIVVGLGDFAEASAVSPTQVLVNGKAAGETTLILWDTGGGRQFFNVTVRPSTFASHDQLEAVRRQLRAELAGQDLSVSTEGGNVYLRGTVNDLNSSSRAALIASTGFGNTIGGISTGQFSPPTVIPVPGSAPTLTISNELNLFAFYPGLNLGATIEAMEQKGLVEDLAEPNILAQNGKQASFLAGGEYPFPMVQGAGVGGSGAVTIAFKEYGIRLNFIPTITPRGTIRLQVAPEVSALDFAHAVSIAGFVEPAITVRRVKTEVELGDRQSFAIGGLLDNTESETFEKIPFLGDIPIIGKFFQTISRTKANTELIVIVTPEIVAPVPTGTEIALPNRPQTFLPPNSNTPMHTPDPATTPGPAPATMPVEQLIESLKPETPLSDSGSGGMGSSGGMGASSGSSTQ